MNEIKCPICQSSASKIPTNRDAEHIVCVKCGDYLISRTVLVYFKYPDIKQYLPKISSWISEQNKIFGVKVPEISSDTADRIVEQKDKTIKEKFDCFMHTFLKLQKNGIELNDYNHCYISNKDELNLLYKKALKNHYIDDNKINHKGSVILTDNKITFDGLEYIESLSEVNKNSKNIFVAFHFTDELQNIFDTDIKSAIEEIGFNYVRVSSSTTDTDTHINDDIIGKIKSSKIVIADFSGQRNSVYFEAGFAMGLKIQVIWTCKESDVDNLSFDTRQYPHILWNSKEDFVDKLIKRIRAIT